MKILLKKLNGVPTWYLWTGTMHYFVSFDEARLALIRYLKGEPL
jgi:hypothetical protein